VADSALAVRLRTHVERLDQPRSHRHAREAMAGAVAYVTGQLAAAGWHVDRREFSLPGTWAAGVNLLAERPGTDPAVPAYLVGAHLDTVPGSPGADDNASGVACLLELAGRLPDTASVLLAVFDEEETGLVGSGVLARELVAERSLVAAIVLECVGYHSDRARSQNLPPGIGLLYPRQYWRMRRRQLRGDWTLLAYRHDAAGLARRLAGHLDRLAGRRAAMRARDPLDLPGLGRLLRRYPGLADQFARSDHKPFWDLGVPAIQVTDTAEFRNPHYHRPTDTPDTLDYDRMADLVNALVTVVNR